MKKLLSVLLSLCVLLSVTAGLNITVSAETEGHYIYLISGDKAIITDNDGEIRGDIEIPSTLGGCAVVGINESAFEYCSFITDVVIPDSVTNIGKEAFNNCEGISSITFGSGLVSIGASAFGWCSGLKEIILPDGLKTIGDNAFDSCLELEAITIPESVTAVGSMVFFGCKSLADVYYGGSPKQWKALAEKENSAELKKATIHFAKEDEPETETSTELTTTEDTIATTTTVTQHEDVSVTSTTTTTTQTEAATSTATVSKPKTTSIKKATAGKKQFKVEWKKVSGVTGYQLQYSTDKKFRKGNKTVTIKGAKKTSTTIKKLKSKKTYYVRIRTYKGKNYSSWSKAKTVKVK